MFRISDGKFGWRLAPRSGRENDVNGWVEKGSAIVSAKLCESEAKSNGLDCEEEEDEDRLRVSGAGAERSGAVR